MAKKVAKPIKKAPAAKKSVSQPNVGPSRAKIAVPRTYLSQEDVPANSVADALRVAVAIFDQYGGRAVTPMELAVAMNLTPSSSHLRLLCGSSIAYGLTQGGMFAESIAPTDLARRVIRPTAEGDDLAAKREAVLKPRVLREFLSKYSGSPLPRPDIGKNVLATLGVPDSRLDAVWDLILDAASSVGYLRTIKERQYVDLGGSTPVDAEQNSDGHIESKLLESALAQTSIESSTAMDALTPGSQISMNTDTSAARRVFITHGKNTSFIDPIKKLLGFGEMIPVVSVEKQSVSQPVPDKVMNDMRSCRAAIIHVDGEHRLIDKDAKEVNVINPNVLIEIGAAMALYGRRFILLVRDDVKLPSNLQGLYEVRYSGEALDGAVTIKLLEAINEMKGTPLPDSA